MQRTRSPPNSRALQTGAAAIEAAHCFQNRLSYFFTRRLFKRNHFVKKTGCHAPTYPWRMIPSTLFRLCASENAPPSGQKVEDEDDQGYDEQEVNKASSYVKAEAEKPQDQNHYKDCPEHIFPFSATRAPPDLESIGGARNAIKCDCC